MELHRKSVKKTERVNLAEKAQSVNAQIADEMITQRLNEPKLQLVEESKEKPKIGVDPGVLSSAEATQNLNIGSIL